MAFKVAGIKFIFKGQAEHETAINVLNGKLFMRMNPIFYRHAKVDLLIGLSTFAKEKLGCVATKSVEQLSHMMVDADLMRHAGDLSF
jgi:GDPmannose 4,6-dehydratase